MTTTFNEQAKASLELIDRRSGSLTLQPAEVLSPMQALQAKMVTIQDLAMLEKMMDLEERWRKAEALRAFNEAMAKFKAMPLSIRKNKKVSWGTGQDATTYWHATLASICEQACPLMASVGLRHNWSVSEAQGGLITVTCNLTHELGHTESVTLTGMPDASGKKNAIQQKGSTVSYLERYTFLAVTGLATVDQDDDGRGGQPQQQGGQMDEGQYSDYMALVEGSADLDELKRNYKSAQDAAVRANDHDAARNFGECKNAMYRKLAAKGAK